MKLSITKPAESGSNLLLREISSITGMINILKGIKDNRSFRQIKMEKFFRTSLVLIALSILCIGHCVFAYTCSTINAFDKSAWDLDIYIGKTWDPVANVYGTYPFLLGTLLTSFLALLISIPFSFAIAIFLGEYYPRGWFSGFLKIR